MTDLPGRLRVMARLTGRDDDADTAAEAAREIERLRLTDSEREAISEVVDCLTETGTALANATTTRNTLAALLERMK